MKYLVRLRVARPVDLPSAVVALTLTIAAFASVFVVGARALSFDVVPLHVSHATPHETLVYLERPDITRAVVEQSPRLESSRAPAPRREVQPTRAPAHNNVAPTREKPTAPTEPNFLPPYRPLARTTPSPFDVPRPRNPFLSEEPRTRAEMDSILAMLRHGIPLFALTRTPTAAERDSAMREESRSRAVPGREAQMPGTAQMSVGLPLFASGPSPAERRRDSAANAEYVARLRRLQARARASRESLRIADSMSRARTP